MAYLSSSLVNNCMLRHLDVSHCDGIGWDAFSAVLQNPNSALEKVNLRFNNINADILASFANSLTHNNKLKELFLDDNVIEDAGWKSLSNTLCNKSNINATFNSNHTLQRVRDPEYMSEYGLSSELKALLQLNRENSKAEAARRKILQVHFSGDSSIQPFIDMDLKALTHAVTWMAKDEHGIPLLYKFLRNTSLLFDVGGE